MLRTSAVRRAGKLLGAATVTGVLSAGLLFSAPLAAHADSQGSTANGIRLVETQARIADISGNTITPLDDANGI